MGKVYRWKNNVGPQTLAELTQWFEDMATQESLPEPIRSQINLILEEHITNVVNYAQPSGDHGPVPLTIEANLLENMVELKIADGGSPFDPRGQEDPELSDSLEDRPIGGLGIFLIRQLSDSLEYEYRDGWNIFYIKKHRSQEEHA